MPQSILPDLRPGPFGACPMPFSTKCNLFKFCIFPAEAWIWLVAKLFGFEAESGFIEEEDEP